ncbi:MAG: T9SS type A sorting domain-containing protein, partial [Chitinophagaceae bacterium]|nr:T9SS type A sorting domain-containing protein [Chitinophagaceae bacterium]
IQITPNTCTNQLTITYVSSLKNIQVLNLNGQNCNIPVAMQGTNAVLHVENLSTGLFILSAVENGVITTTKFYKN